MMTDITGKLFEDALDLVMQAVEPDATDMAQSTGRTVPSCMSTIVREMMKQKYEYGTIKAIEDSKDARLRQFTIKFWWWDVYGGLSNADLLAETDPEEVAGLEGIREAVQEYADALYQSFGKTHEDIDEMSSENLMRKLKNLRTTISRKGGHGTLRVYYTSPQTNSPCMCQCEVTRAQKELDGDV